MTEEKRRKYVPPVSTPCDHSGVRYQQGPYRDGLYTMHYYEICSDCGTVMKSWTVNVDPDEGDTSVRK